MLLNNTEIFNSLLSVYGAGPPVTGLYYTSSDFYDLLGRGEKLVVQAIVDSGDVSGVAGLTVTINYERSNDGKVWETPATGQFTLAIAQNGPLPKSVFFDTSSSTVALGLGAKGRFTLRTDVDKTLVRLLVSTRG